MIQSTCTVCKETKDAALFPRNERNKSGVDSHCKSCRAKARSVKLQKNNPEYYKRKSQLLLSTDTHRFCKSCENLKKVEHFSFVDKNKTTRQYDCKSCASEYAKKRYAQKKDIIAEKSKLHYLKNKERRLLKSRERELRVKYSMTFADLESMREMQNNCCSICHVEFGENNNCNIDHNHITGVVRGLLCSKCNFAIGSLKTDIGVELLQNAIEYIKRTEDYI